MKIALRAFLSSMTFGFSIAAIYWLTAHEPVGTALLGIFGAAFLYVSAYLALAMRDAELDGDRPIAPADLAGERIGVFSLESPWPAILAFASAAFLVGVVLHPVVAAGGGAAFFLLLWLLVKENR